MTWQRNFSFIILAFVVVFHAVMLFPEVAELSPELNDNVFHHSLCVSMLEEIETGGNPIDHWVPYWSIGYPVFHHYHHLPHLAVVLTHLLTFKQVPLFFIFKLFFYILLVVYPLVLYYSLRRMKFSPLASALAALFSLAMSNLNSYGFELSAYTWRGSGMYTQLWAMVFFPLALSSIYVTVRKGKNYFRSVILLFLLTMSHMIFGLMAVLTAGLFLFMDFDRAKTIERLKRFGLVLAVFLVMIAYFLIPLMLDGAYHAHSTYDPLEKWDSYGFRYVVTNFLNGKILDSGRWPVATVLAVFGLFFALSKKAWPYRWAGISFMMWFLLYFGRPAWGGLIDLLPLSSALHLHRFVTMVHFFGALLAGLGLSAFIKKIRLPCKPALAAVVIVLVAWPVFSDRFEYLKINNLWLRDNKSAYLEEAGEFEGMIDHIGNLPPGRVYPGRKANWGKNFKIGQTAVYYFLGPRKIPALTYLPFSWSLAGDFSVNFNEWRKSHCNLFNIRYILAEKGWHPPAFARWNKASGRFRLYEIETTGYFDLVDSSLAVYADKDSIWNLMVMWLRSRQVDRKQFISIFFDRKPHEGYGDYLVLKDRHLFWRTRADLGVALNEEAAQDIFSLSKTLERTHWRPAAGRVLNEGVSKNRYFAGVNARRDCFLLFKMTYHPGWRVYVDGEEKAKVILSPGLIGVRLAKGEHKVECVYRAPRWKNFLAVVSVFAAAGLLLWEKRRK